MVQKLKTIATAAITLILLSSMSDLAFGKLIEVPSENQFDYWYWRQPPYIISPGYQGYPYVLPSSEIVLWGGKTNNILFSYTRDDQRDSPYPEGLYRSYDSGQNWDHLPFNFYDNDFLSLIVHPISPTIMLVGTANSNLPGGMYRSSDGGDTWENVLANRIIYDIEVDPSNSNRIYASTCCWGGVFRSEDYGQTWNKISDQAIGDIEVHPITPDILFGARYFSTNRDEGIYRSDNAGETWIQIANIGGQSNIIIDSNQPNRMFAFGRSYGGIWRTEDGGVNWVDLSSGLPYIVSSPTVLSAALDSNHGALWIGLKYDGILVSHDYGVTWSESNNGIPFFIGSIFGPQCTSITIALNGAIATNCSGRVYVKNRLETIYLPLIINK